MSQTPHSGAQWSVKLQGDRLLRPRFVLASGSPRRSELLTSVGLEFLVRPADICEDFWPSEKPEEAVVRLARTKARSVRELSGAGDFDVNLAVLSADTVVVLDEEIFGKPSGLEHGRQMLTKLSARTHRVMTGWCLLGPEREIFDSEVSEIKFRDLSAKEIDLYLACGEYADKAGAYAIQGRGGYLIEKVSGSYTNIVGLPLAEVVKALTDMLGAAGLGLD
ncbi:MAG: Maf family protein [Deltaproteobacteria bacterium]|nr:Maf family protein [Deltaproteobacteria bacterium]